MVKHYNEAHEDLKALGLEIIQEGGGQNRTAKGKISNALITQVMMIGLLNKVQIRDIMKNLNEEWPQMQME